MRPQRRHWSPRAIATDNVSPVTDVETRNWLATGKLISLVRTTELIGAIRDGLGVALEQADESMVLQTGDEALLISLSFSVLLAWAQGGIVPLEEDWRCLLVQVRNPSDTLGPTTALASEDISTDVAEG